MSRLVALFIALLVLSGVFWLVERWRPGLPGQRRRAVDTRVDVTYWFFTPLITRMTTRIALAVPFAAIAWWQGLTLSDLQMAATSRHTWASSLPLAVQVPLILVLADLFAYWTHRLFHGRILWRFHAIHHSSTTVDWLSSVRLHPVNDALARVVQVVPLYWLGFNGVALAAFVPFLTFYALMIHANVDWSYGPLRYVIASPVFHRWHHTSEEEGLDTNFAGLFPFIDLAFGTFYMPAGRQPRRFGLANEGAYPTVCGASCSTHSDVSRIPDRTSSYDRPSSRFHRRVIMKRVLVRTVIACGVASLLLVSGPPLRARDTTQTDTPQPDGTVHSPAQFAGVWDYNQIESVNAATGRPEQTPRGAQSVVARAGVPAGRVGGAGRGTSGETGSTGGRTGGGGGGESSGYGAGASAYGNGGLSANAPRGLAVGMSPAMLQENRDLTRDLLEIPESLTIKVGDHDVSITDDLGRERKYPTDGSRQKYRLGAAEFLARALWEGPQLKKQIQGGYDFRMTETYFLSPDAQHLFVIVRVGDQTPNKRANRTPPIIGANRVYDRLDR